MAFKNITNALFPKGTDEIDEFEETEESAYEDMAGSADSKVVLIEPSAVSESPIIADHLKKRNSVVVNLQKVMPGHARRIIDFLSGTLYAMGGDLQKIGENIYLCTPKNVNVEGRISDEETEKKRKEKESDDFDF